MKFKNWAVATVSVLLGIFFTTKAVNAYPRTSIETELARLENNSQSYKFLPEYLQEELVRKVIHIVQLNDPWGYLIVRSPSDYAEIDRLNTEDLVIVVDVHGEDALVVYKNKYGNRAVGIVNANYLYGTTLN